MNKYKEIAISKSATISDALKQMDEVKRKLLIVINESGTFYRLISIGDIQRAIISNKDLKTPIKDILRNEVTVAHVDDNIEDVKNHIRVKRNDFMPVIDDNHKIVKIIFWEDLFGEKKKPTQFNLPVVIMAGGKGSRMKPLTNVLPKPLIPVNEKTIIENIMDRFVQHGCHDFFISVNYKADLIRYYFHNLNNSQYNITYFEENKPLGTAGSLSLLKGKINKTFFVSNCDIIIDEDYNEILKYHNINKNELTAVAAMKHYPIPYGILKTGEKSQLKEIEEKPELIFKINSGMYLIEPHVLDDIPENSFINITDLINKLLEKKRKVGVFPVTEKSWKDIGEWNQYLSSLSK